MVVYPRWRGELVLTDKNNIFCGGLSPLARGTRRERDSETPPGSVYPRWRGELCRTAFCICTVLGLSPLARGTLVQIVPGYFLVRFIPAGAGNSSASKMIAAMITVYPRWRGELEFCRHELRPDAGLSPLARGTRRIWWRGRYRFRFIPAGAGNSPTCASAVSVCAVYPRWRGELSAVT